MYTANILEASQVMLDLYAALMDHFDCDNNYTGYKFWKDPRATTPMQLAGTLYYHFPAHFYKALHTIHQYEEEHHELTTSLLKQKKITVVDIGAGIGTFSLALMDFLYKWSNSIKTELDVILIEPNTLTHEIAKKLITTHAAKTGIVLNSLEIISEPFPESRCLEQVCAVIERIPVEFLAIAMCNLLHWLGKDIFFTLFGASYQKEYQFIATLIGIAKPLHGALYSVETRKSILGFSLKTFYRLLKKTNDVYFCKEPNNIMITYKNFPRSAYENIPIYKNNYWSAVLVINTAITQMTRPETLRLSYFKARMALRREFPCDEVEIRLFEQQLDKNLSICAQQIKHGYRFWQKPIQFEAPKDAKNMRPKVIDCVPDALVGAAFLDVLGRLIDRHFLEVNCGNRLAKKAKSEYVYEWFWLAWKQKYYNASLKEATKKGLKYYCQMDIESFYPSVSQARLISKLRNLIPWRDSRIWGLIQSLVEHKWRNSKEGYGLPQGPLPSGFLANVYLDEFDNFVVQKLKCLYRCYVDDMLFFAKDKDELKELQKRAGDYLEKKLELHINDAKTYIGHISELRRKVTQSELDDFDQRLKRLLRSFYNLDKNYIRLFKAKAGEFVVIYSKLLQELGIYINEQWLLRRLVYKKSIYKYLMDYFGKSVIPIKYPKFPAGIHDAKRWVKEFEALNPRIIEEIKALRQHLAQDMKRLYTQYGSLDDESLDKDTYKQVRARYRFYTYRAGILKVPEIISILRELLPKPWLYSLICLRAYPELTGDIISNLKSARLRYIQYAMIWALGELKASAALPVLQDILFGKDSMLLKLVTSQALLKIDVGNGFDCHRLWLEIEKNKHNPRLLKNLLLLLRYCSVSEKQRKKLEHELNSLGGIDGNLCRLALKWAFEEKRNLLGLLDLLPETIEPEDYPEIEPDIQIYGIS
ncbi:reverse transcriptase domain-containing protein [Neomoorella thermoacetica]|uniref:reverse transcriptase domain-containing protein n=1 Tax=Neomoorella thermoacetica TaxID=1525 RepID=UPI0030CC9ACD